MRKPQKDKTRSLYFPERITAAMKSIFDYPLTIVEAPMGYGKTTAVKEHLNNSAANILWKNIFDSSITGFWSGFCRLLSELDGPRSQSLLRLGFPNESVVLQEALNIIEDIEIPEDTVLVVDDYHLIDSLEINRFIELLVKNEIINLPIVLTARYTEFPNLSELSLKGYLQHITKETFELRSVEIMKYYKLCGIYIKDAEADNLYSHTEGWISALYMVMLSFIEEGSFFHTTNVNKLIEKAVFTPFPGEIKDFFITMCIFDSFTLEQASYMWEQENTGVLLSEITNKNAFVKYDPRIGTYQIHNIFANFLRDRFASKEKHDRQGVYQRVAQWYMKKGDYLKAMDYFYQAECFDQMLEATEKDMLKSIDGEKKDLLIKHYTECPEDIRMRYPVALILYGMTFLSFNEMALFDKVCSEIRQSLVTDENLNDEARNNLLGEFELLQSFTKYNDIDKMSEHHQKAFGLLGKPSSIYIPTGSWTFGSPSVMYMFYRESGRLADHVSVMQKALKYYYSLTNNYGNGAEYIMEAERYFNMADFTNAEITVIKALYKAQSNQQTGIMLCADFLQMRLAFAKGDFPLVLEHLRKMRENITNRLENQFIYTIGICEGFVYSFLKQENKIPRWIVQGDFENNRLPFPVLAMINIVYGRTLLIEGEYSKLIGSSEHFIGLASAFPNLLGQIYTYIYLAAANQNIFREKEALSELLKALDIAMPDQVYMPFVENCDYIKTLLGKLSRQGIYGKDITRILELYQVYQKSVEQMIKENFSGEEKPKLTDRELQIALLAADGLNNKQIGDKLYISPNTVKVLLKSIFGKLGVNSRVLLKQYF